MKVAIALADGRGTQDDEGYEIIADERDEVAADIYREL
jgi:hypothetical protein